MQITDQFAGYDAWFHSKRQCLFFVANAAASMLITTNVVDVVDGVDVVDVVASSLLPAKQHIFVTEYW